MSLSGSKMNRFYYHRKYSLYFKVSLIFSETIVILLFVISPNLSTSDNKIITLDNVDAIELIPPTTYSLQQSKPLLPKIELSDEAVDELILEDVHIQNTNPPESEYDTNKTTMYTSNYFLNSEPRQILEVLPQQSEGEFKGSVTLKLKINENGKVADYKIVTSDLNCNDCINNILSAAYKSVWEPAVIKGKTEEYWIEKTYNFN
jgi:hypothetical protein